MGSKMPTKCDKCGQDVETPEEKIQRLEAKVRELEGALLIERCKQIPLPAPVYPWPQPEPPWVAPQYPQITYMKTTIADSWRLTARWFR